MSLITRVPLDTGDYTVDHSTQLVLINPKVITMASLKHPTVKLCCEATWRSIDGSSNF